VSEKTRRLLALLMVFAFVAAACGSSSDDAGDDGSEDVESDAGADDESDGGDDTAGADDETDGDSADAAADGEVGAIVDGVAIGTSGFTIDTNVCPSDWDNHQGITDDEIKLGHSYPFSGTLAAYGATSDGMKAWFEAKSAEDPDRFGGREVTLAAKDDAYEPARVVASVQELIQQDGVAAITVLAGTAGNLGVYDDLNTQCVPHLFASSGHPAWGDPVNHPWSTPSFLSYSTEGQLWARYLLDEQSAGNLPDPVRVANLTMNNDFGLAMLNGFKGAVAESDGKIEIVGDELHDAAAPNVTNELTSLGGTDADVVIAGTVGVACAQTMTGVAEASWDPAVKIIAAVCLGAAQFEPAGEAGDGWVVTGGAKDLKSSLHDGDPIIEEGRAIFDDAGVDWQNNANAGTALLFAIPILDTLERADDLPGGISRTNMMISARSADFEHPYYAEGIRWHMDGLNDVYTIEASQLVKHKFSADVGYAEPEPIGDVINLDGQTPFCEWDGSSC